MDFDNIIKLISALVPLVIVIILIVLIRSVYIKAKRRINGLSRQMFGTSSIIEGIKQTEQRVQNTPRSISGGDSMFIDKIMADFPEFNLNNAKTVISEALAYIYKGKNISDKYPEMLLENVDTSYAFGKIHKIAISGYEKSYNDACIKFQAAYEVKANGILKQLRAEIEYSFKISENSSLKCPYCGAPISKMGVKRCEFCGHGIVYDIDDTWQITKIRI